MRPGEIFFGEGNIVGNAGRRTVILEVTNSSDHVVFVSSHYHFFEANRRLVFDREAAFGMRLDIPAGETVLWEPSQTREVRLVELGGKRWVEGFNGLVNGPLTPKQKAIALRRARERGFLGRRSD